jgi:hypothetical protein
VNDEIFFLQLLEIITAKKQTSNERDPLKTDYFELKNY